MMAEDLHETEGKQGSDGNLLSQTKSQLKHFNNREGQDHNIQDMAGIYVRNDVVQEVEESNRTYAMKR